MSHFSKVTPRGRSHAGFIVSVSLGSALVNRPFSGAELGSASPRAAWSGGLDRKLSVVVLPGNPQCEYCLPLALCRQDATALCTDLRAEGRTARRVPGLWQRGNQVVLTPCHVPGSWPHRTVCHKAGMETLLSTHFTDKETEVQGTATRG